MAKIIRIKILNEDSVAELNKNNSVIEAPLLDHLQVQSKSQFETLAELVPIIDTIKNKALSISASLNNRVSAGIIDLANMFDIPRWKKTDPIRLTFKFKLYTKTDPKLDVFIPAKILQAQSILSPKWVTKKDKKSGQTQRGSSKQAKSYKTYVTPGISLSSFKAFNQTGGDVKISKVLKQTKLVSVEVPGVIYIPLAIVESAVPTFSKEETESGLPLWADIDLQIVSIRPASTEYYDYVFDKKTKRTKTNIKSFERG